MTGFGFLLDSFAKPHKKHWMRWNGQNGNNASFCEAMNAKQSCELIKKERKNFVGKKDIEYLEKDIILKRAKMNVIEEDGGNSLA